MREGPLHSGTLFVGQFGLRLRACLGVTGRIAWRGPCVPAPGPASAIWWGAADKRCHSLGQLALERCRLATVDPLLLAHELSVVHQHVDDVRHGRGAKQFGEPPAKLVLGQTRAPGALGLEQYVADRRSGARRSVTRHAEGAGAPVGEGKADAEYPRQRVGLLVDLTMRPIA